jgi:hypothetical protein
MVKQIPGKICACDRILWQPRVIACAELSARGNLKTVNARDSLGRGVCPLSYVRGRL